MKNFPHATKDAIHAFVDRMNETFAEGEDGFIKNYYISNNGRKYQKIAQRMGSQSSVVCFIDAQGNIWKAASWKAPALNFIRGSIFDENYGVGTAVQRFGTI